MWLICSLHGAGEWHDLHGDLDEIVLGDFAVGQFGLGDRGDYALLDLGPGPTDGEAGQLRDVEAGRIYAPLSTLPRAACRIRSASSTARKINFLAPCH
jgi:hypothetical protein